MKNMEFQQFMKKVSLITLTFVTAVTLTGCSLSFNSNTPAPEGSLESIPQVINEKIETGKQTTQALQELSESIDYASISKDMTDEELESLMSEVLEDSQDIASDIDAEFVSASLVRVVDGDTIVVNIDGNEAKVRMIGIDTPESVASKEYLERTGKENTEEGFSASDYTKELLSDVDTVWLEQDVSDTDRYGRLLRYVWLEVPEEVTTETIATYMVNGILLSDKIAKPVEYEPDTKYADSFDEIYEEYTY